jgi:hypothetical protein
MVATAAHVADHVLTAVPVRQWVLSAPWALRALLATDASVLSAVVRIFVDVVTRWYTGQARAAGVENPHVGCLSFVQRFGGSLNLHVHDHCVFADGVFAKDGEGRVTFHAVEPPGRGDIENVVREVARRVGRMLRRRGFPRDDVALDEHLAAGLVPGRFERIGDSDEARAIDDLDERKRSRWSAEVDGYSVHAGGSMRGDDAEGRERLIRYCARPPLSLERLKALPDGRVAYRTKYPRRGGKTHRVMTPMELMARLAALVPPPRHPLLRYGGVFAPASKWRALVVPRGATTERKVCPREDGEGSDERNAAPVAVRSRRGKKSREAPEAHEQPATLGRPSYVDWASLMRRAFDLDVLECPKCHGRMKPIAVITERETIDRILTHLGLPLRPEPLVLGGVAYDVTGEPILVDPEEQGAPPDRRERSPPAEWDFVDPPAPDT